MIAAFLWVSWAELVIERERALEEGEQRRGNAKLGFLVFGIPIRVFEEKDGG